jgi:YfiH family protein
MMMTANKSKHDWITPNWSAPQHIKAFATTRLGGVSEAPFDSMNLGMHVEDKREHVSQNRQHLVEALNLPAEPLWLEQVHSKKVVNADHFSTDFSQVFSQIITADASISHTENTVCIVMTADCLPVLLTNRQGNVVGAVHAGWRGLKDGIIEATLQKMACDPTEIIAWLGPAIGADAFEVGDDVRDAFLSSQQSALDAFKPAKTTGKWFADMYALARLRLHNEGVEHIFGGDYCTYQDKARFFSYRREGKTGRMASLVFIQHEA